MHWNELRMMMIWPSNKPTKRGSLKKKWLNYKFNYMSLKRLFIVDIKCNLSYEHEHLVWSLQVWGRLAKFLVKLQSQVCKWTSILIDIWCFDSMFRSNYNFVLLFCSSCLVNGQVREMVSESSCPFDYSCLSNFWTFDSFHPFDLIQYEMFNSMTNSVVHSIEIRKIVPYKGLTD